MPLVNRTFDQLIDFTRTSAATFVNSSGNIASTPQSRNLLTFTNEFANAAWTKTRSSITANSTAAPDGTNTADTLNEDSTASSTHPVSVAVTLAAAAHTLSIYVKASGRSWVQISLLSTANAFANFNVSTGALGTVGAAATATITSVGNGWYRCTMTATTGAGANTVAIYPASADNTVSFTGTGIASLFIWGAQLEQASSATDYTRNFGGLFPPRFDYDPVTRAPRGLLIEEQRTNLLTYSEQFDNAAWTKTDSVITANAIVSPDGAVNAEKIAENVTSVGQYMARQTYGSFVAGAYTFTYYAKAAERTWTYFEVGNTYAYVNLSTGAVGSTGQFSTGWTFGSASATAVGNGWYRCSITSTCTTPGSYSGGKIHVAQSNNVIAYAGTIGSGIYIWGAQLEAGAFATSYIPTVASQVTRSADVAAINAPNFANWFNQTAGSFVFEGTILAASTAEHQLGYGVGGGTFGVNLRVNDRFGAGTRFLNTDASLDIAIATSPTPNTVTKIAAAYSGGTDAALVRGGGAAATDTSYSASAGNTLIVLGANASGTGAFLNGHIRSLRYYPTRLTNAQLQALTA